MERVRVEKPAGIELADVSSLPEGNRPEYYAAKQFLEIFNRDRQVPYEIDLLQDCPDVACTPAPFYIEVATVFDTPTDASKLLGRGEGVGDLREIHAAIRQVKGILRDKASKRYGVVNCILVIRHGVPIFTGRDFRRFVDKFIIPKTHGFDEIYLLTFLETNGLLTVGGDLLRLFPT